MINHSWPMLGLKSDFMKSDNSDILVIGSDEMFNCTMPQYADRPMSLFGMGYCKKKISYAASFGDTTIEKIKRNNITDALIEALNSFSSISVRDQNSFQIVETLTGIQPSINLDPVLMYDFTEIDNIRVKHKDYIAVYGYGNNINDPMLIKYLKEFAKNNGLKLLAVGNGQDFCDEVVALSAFDVLAYMKNARYVVTNTFHGAIFSLKYNIPFAVQLREMNINKLGDLLNRFHVNNRIISTENFENISSVLEIPLDTVFINQMIRSNQLKTKEYLKRNIVG